jgi:hypothetical protein
MQRSTPPAQPCRPGTALHPARPVHPLQPRRPDRIIYARLLSAPTLPYQRGGSRNWRRDLVHSPSSVSLSISLSLSLSLQENNQQIHFLAGGRERNGDDVRRARRNAGRSAKGGREGSRPSGCFGRRGSVVQMWTMEPQFGTSSKFP